MHGLRVVRVLNNNDKDEVMAFKVLDLFSGAGGLSRRFYDAGWMRQN